MIGSRVVTILQKMIFLCRRKFFALLTWTSVTCNWFGILLFGVSINITVCRFYSLNWLQLPEYIVRSVFRYVIIQGEFTWRSQQLLNIIFCNSFRATGLSCETMYINWVSVWVLLSWCWIRSSEVRMDLREVLVCAFRYGLNVLLIWGRRSSVMSWIILWW